MRRFLRLCLYVCASCVLFSCRADKGSPTPSQLSQKLILGKWTLQQEQYMQYVDGVKKQDTTLNATQYNHAYLQFNNDGTFASSSLYSSGIVGNLGNGPESAVDSTGGTYGFSGVTFSLSAPIAGLSSGETPTAFSGPPPVITPVSHVATLSQLTNASLKIHTEYVYTYTVNNISQTYKMTDDYFYTK